MDWAAYTRNSGVAENVPDLPVGYREHSLPPKGKLSMQEAGRLHDLAARHQNVEDFEALLVDLRVRNGRNLSFLDLLNRAGLRPDRVTR